MLATVQAVASANRRVVSTAPVADRFEPAVSPKEADWAALMQRAASGDHVALAELYDASSPMVFGLALRILGDRDAAEDAVVEVYAQAWRDAKSFDSRRGTPASWLLTLTRSRAIDMRRSRRHDQSADPLESAAEVRSAAPDPEEASSAAEQRRFVRGALGGLKSEQREAIELAYYSGLSHTEIAVKLGQPLGTIKTRIRLGMMRMRELLDHLGASAAGAPKETT